MTYCYSALKLQQNAISCDMQMCNSSICFCDPSCREKRDVEQKLKQFKTFNKRYLLSIFMLNMKNSSLERSVERFGDFKKSAALLLFFVSFKS